MLRALEIETHLVISRAGALTISHETEHSLHAVRGLADVVHADGDIGAACASGSFRTMGMLVAPCSMKTLGAIASGVTGTLTARAADVALKDRRPLVLMVRETPLNLIHLRNMELLTQAGAILAPPVPAFYARPRSIDDLVSHSVGRCLDLFGLDTGTVRRWGGVAGIGSGAPRSVAEQVTE
jgi:4-hydroxy-3-polyprenylbenzoate decarboxylase